MTYATICAVELSLFEPRIFKIPTSLEQCVFRADFTNDQIIEGQFTVLLLGFDEDRSNSDVMMKSYEPDDGLIHACGGRHTYIPQLNQGPVHIGIDGIGHTEQCP